MFPNSSTGKDSDSSRPRSGIRAFELIVDTNGDCKGREYLQEHDQTPASFLP